MITIPSAPSAPSFASVQAVELTMTNFVADVIQASRKQIVLVAFWANFSESSKQFIGVLEKVVGATKGTIKLGKVDAEKNAQISQQMGVQSVPAVYAFFGGQPVDGFTGAQPEATVKAWVEHLSKVVGAPQSDEQVGLDKALEQAAEYLNAGDAATAQSIYVDILSMQPDSTAAYVGLARCFLAAKNYDQLKELLEAAPESVRKDKLLDPIRTALALAAETAQAADALAETRQKLAQDPKDYQARFDLAMGLYATGAREEAVDELLTIIAQNRTWNDDGARKQLVKFFDAFGPTDPLTIASRKRLSSILFS